MKNLLIATLFIANLYGAEKFTIGLSDNTVITLSSEKNDLNLATYIVWFLEPIKNSPTKDLLLKTLHDDGFLNKNEYLKKIESKGMGTWCYASNCEEHDGDIFMKNLDNKRYDQERVTKVINLMNSLKRENKNRERCDTGLSNTLRKLFLEGKLTRPDYKPGN